MLKRSAEIMLMVILTSINTVGIYAVAASDSPCYYSESISNGNGKTSQNGQDERDGAASCFISCINGNIGIKNEFSPCYRKRKPVKARSLKALL